MNVHMLRIEYMPNFKHDVTVHTTMPRAMDYLEAYVAERWDDHQLGDWGGYLQEGAISRFFNVYKDHYHYRITQHEFFGPVDPEHRLAADEVVLTAQEVEATMLALRNLPKSCLNGMSFKMHGVSPGDVDALLLSTYKKLGL